MTTSRLDTFRAMVVKSPTNALARFGLANEAIKEGLWAEAAEQLEAYLDLYDDEGNGFGRLAEAYTKLGRTDDARRSLERGVKAAEKYGHPSMASELRQRMEELTE
jgi:E3 SUMO-protein ligase RanBP2